MKKTKLGEILLKMDGMLAILRDLKGLLHDRLPAPAAEDQPPEKLSISQAAPLPDVDSIQAEIIRARNAKSSNPWKTKKL